MNPTHDHNLPYWWSGMLGIFSFLSLQDYVFILGAAISAYFTIKTYYAKRREERQRIEEEKKRTRLLAEYLKKSMHKPDSEPPSPPEVISDALNKAGEK